MYWDVTAMYWHFVACLEQLGAQGVKLDSIGIDTWGVDFGCVGADGSLLDLPRCYRDPYTGGVPEKVYAKVPREQLYARTGIQIMNFNTIFQLYVQTEAGDPALAGADAILFMPDLLSYLLTGKKVCEYTDASTSGMMDQATRQFNKQLLSELGIGPVCLLHGTWDPIVPISCSDRYQKLYTNSVLHIIRGTDHLFLFHRHRVSRLIIDFLGQ